MAVETGRQIDRQTDHLQLRNLETMLNGLTVRKHDETRGH
jgi:hypothetical protein